MQEKVENIGLRPGVPKVRSAGRMRPMGRISAALVWAHNLLTVSYIAYDVENLVDISEIFLIFVVQLTQKQRASKPRSPRYRLLLRNNHYFLRLKALCTARTGMAALAC